ncbi:MAG: hypothetical protein SFX73_10930 [Kofleriaceae bacterium]|nr:hypothetical protein [Kofleriaceae bacterium]
MGLKVTREQIESMTRQLESAKARAASLRESGEKAVERVVRTGEVVGTAGMFGVLNGRTGGVQLLGVPLDLASGVALHAFGLLGGAGRHSDHVHNMADGALASFAVSLGTEVGARMRREALAARTGVGTFPAQAGPTGGGAASGGALPTGMVDAADRAMANALAHMARG